MNYPREGLTRRAPEFQAIVLAGHGTNLEPLTAYHGERPSPKALLPIGNKAMLNFPLAWLEDAGIRDVLLVAPSAHKAALSHFIHSEASFPTLKIDLETIDSNEEMGSGMGTADIIRRFSDRIQSDFIVLPCDFIPPPGLKFNTLLNAHRVHPEEPLVTALLYERGEAIKDGPEKLTLCIDKKNEALMYVDADEDEEEFEIPMSLLWRSPSTYMTSRYLDAHVYVFKKAVLDLLQQKKSISSIREDLIPWLCKIQFQLGKRSRWGAVLNPNPNPQILALSHSTVQKPVLHSQNDRKRLSQSQSTVQSTTTSRHASPQSFPFGVPESTTGGGTTAWTSLRCGIVRHHLEDGYAARANTLGTYIESNRQSLREGSYKPKSMDSIHLQTQISTDSIIGAGTSIAEKTSVKKSVIGNHCKIGVGVKISGCVVMDYVVIEDGAKLDNCVLSAYTQVGSRAVLKDCESEPGYAVPPDSSSKGERLEAE